MCRVHTRQCSIVGSLLDDKKVPTISGIYKSEGVLRVLRIVEGPLAFRRNTTWGSAREWRCGCGSGGGAGLVEVRVWWRCGSGGGAGLVEVRVWWSCGGGAGADAVVRM